MSEAERHKSTVLSMMLNTIKYREARIPALEKVIERFDEATDDDSIKEAADLGQILEKNRQRLAEIKQSARWLLDEWADSSVCDSAKAIYRTLHG